MSLNSGFVASVGIVPLSAFRPGAVVEPGIAATLGRPFPIDNMEALAVEQDGTRTLLWIASDDNYSGLQRTLLLQFALIG